MSVEGEQESECERVEDVWEERGCEEERRGMGFGERARLSPSLIHLGRAADEHVGIHAGQSREVKRAERVDVQQDGQRENKVGYVGRRPIPEEPDVPVRALDVCIDRGKQAPIAPSRVAGGVGRAKQDVGFVVVMNERNKRDRGKNDAVQHPSGRGLEREIA